MKIMNQTGSMKFGNVKHMIISLGDSVCQCVLMLSKPYPVSSLSFGRSERIILSGALPEFLHHHNEKTKKGYSYG